VKQLSGVIHGYWKLPIVQINDFEVILCQCMLYQTYSTVACIYYNTNTDIDR